MRVLAIAAMSSSLATATAAASPHPPAASAGAGSLDGVWTNASYTTLKRPKSLHALVLTPQEAAAYEATLRGHGGVSARPSDTVGQIDSEFIESGDGLARVGGEIRSSWITDPADGQVPYSDEAKRRLRFGAPDVQDNPEDLSASDRCLFSNGSAPPQMSTMETNLLQIVEAAGAVAIVSEKNHDLRLVELFTTRPPPRRAPSWTGNSVGHWEGATLVVETRDFRQPLVDRFSFSYSGAAVIEERFTRTDPDTILYRFKVHDPEMFKSDWAGEEVFRATRARMFEFACHEGNYSIANMLRGARREELEVAGGSPRK